MDSKHKLRLFVRRVIQEAITKRRERGPFDLEAFKTLTAPLPDRFSLYNTRLAFLKQHANYIGAGVARQTFDIGNKQVIKLAKPAYVDQNEKEIEASKCSDTNGTASIITRVLAHADDATWLIAEKADDLFGDDDERLADEQSHILGLPNDMAFDDPGNLVYLIRVIRSDGPAFNDVAEAQRDWLKEHPSSWFNTLMKLVSKCHVVAADFHSGNWGVKNGKLVLVDYGF